MASRKRFRGIRLCSWLILLPGLATPFQSGTLQLDQRGKREVVSFDHQKHEGTINPGPEARFKAVSGAACMGCHHTLSARGIPQLWKCASCHGAEGHPKNPKNRDFDEVWSERAFHDTCIACHRASTKGPTTCAGCHKLS